MIIPKYFFFLNNGVSRLKMIFEFSQSPSFYSWRIEWAKVIQLICGRNKIRTKAWPTPTLCSFYYSTPDILNLGWLLSQPLGNVGSFCVFFDSHGYRVLGERPRVLLNIQQCTEQTPTTKNYLAQNVNSVEIKETLPPPPTHTHKEKVSYPINKLELSCQCFPLACTVLHYIWNNTL